MALGGSRSMFAKAFLIIWTGQRYVMILLYLS